MLTHCYQSQFTGIRCERVVREWKSGSVGFFQGVGREEKEREWRAAYGVTDQRNVLGGQEGRFELACRLSRKGRWKGRKGTINELTTVMVAPGG